MPDKIKLPAPNLLDKAIAQIAPRFALRRYRTRATFAIAGGYTGASRSRRSLSGWSTRGNDPDSDVILDLNTLRERCRDLDRNTPIATGIINTKVTEVVGGGLRHQARLDREVLGLSEEETQLKEKQIEREWSLFWDTPECDSARTLNGNAITQQVYRQEKTNGDVIILLPRFKHTGGLSPYKLKVQVIEADRLCNENDIYNTKITAELAGGIRKNQYGAPVEYHILKQHPGNLYASIRSEWIKVPAFGRRTGLKNIIHLFQPIRPGQSRGVPDLAPVIELIKMLGSYTSNEALATEIASLFSVFVTTESGEAEFDISETKDETGAGSDDKDLKLAPGAVLGLAPGEEIQTANPGRPNPAFDGFILAVSRQIGTAVNLPYEILVKHFTASYSAARAALLTVWKYFQAERQWLASNFNQVVKEVWMYEAVASGRIAAPGFFSDPLIRKAYCGSYWTGPAKGMIDEKKEADAAGKRLDLGISTLTEETIQMTGGDWERNHPQSAREYRMRKEAGLIPDPKVEPALQTVNERRISEGLEPMPGGDAIYIPSSMIPAIEKEEEEEE